MTRIRRMQRGDEAALAEICLRTADAGADATGLLDDDDVWAEIFVLPYAARHPDFALVAVDDDERVVGYAVAAPDTAAFEAWFRNVWWPRFSARWPAPAPDAAARQDDLLRYAYGRGPGAEPYGDTYPAHLHIDLLPEAQGQGWGRRLIQELTGRLREAGVTGVHLVAAAENSGAVAFYERLGFSRLAAPDDVRAFGMFL